MGKLLLLGLVLPVIIMSGCTDPCTSDAGDMISKDFSVSKFHSIDFNGAGTLYARQEAGQSLRIEADEGMIETLSVDVVNGKLAVSSSCPGNIKPITVYASMEDVNELSGSGDVNIISKTGITMDALGLNMNGSGYFDMVLDVDELNTAISGSGDTKLEGRAGIHNINISDTANIRAFALLTERTDVMILGSGQVEIAASKKIDATISGGGSVFYIGNPSVTQNVLGYGKIEKI